MKQLLGVTLLTLLSSVVALSSVTVDSIHNIPTHTYVEVVKEIEHDTGILLAGGECPINSKGRVQVLGFSNDKKMVLAKYVHPNSYENHCPDGSIFFLELSELEQFNTRFDELNQNKVELDLEIDQILERYMSQ